MDDGLVYVKKRNGDRVLFDEQKLIHALKSSGAQPLEIDAALLQVKSILYDGISTHKIYQTAYRSLRKRSHHSAGRYRLKKAMMELGPSGYPFEKFVGKIFEGNGYRTQVGIIVQGACVQHEVDVVARNNSEQIMVECKYHSDVSIKSDVKVALYIHSRFLDVSQAWKEQSELSHLNFKGMIVTNTRFSDDAMQYAKCVGLELISWDYPRGNSLKDRIDRLGFHPVTSLSRLSKSEKQSLLEAGIVLCRDLPKHRDVMKKLGFNQQKIDRVLGETAALTGDFY
ncbi:MAG: restriction endonuclease [Bacteroidales bacterium]|nr:restriction endonuclease [Bacteroidales bacterium]